MRKRKRSCCFLAVLLMVPLLFAPVHAQQQGELLVDCDRIEGWSSPGGQYGTKLSLSSMKREGSGSLQVEFLGRGQTPFQGFAGNCTNRDKKRQAQITFHFPGKMI